MRNMTIAYRQTPILLQPSCHEMFCRCIMWRMTLNLRLLCVALGVVMIACPAAVAVADAPPASLRLSGTIPLPGVGARVDQITIDDKRQRVFIASTGERQIVVADLSRQVILQRVESLQQPQCVLFLPQANVLAVSDAAMGVVRFYDGVSLTLLRESPQRQLADSLATDPTGRLVYVAHGRGGLTALDIESGHAVAEVELHEHPEEFAFETRGNRVFVNIARNGTVAVVDRQSHEVIATWSLPEVQANTAMALDEEHQRLFIACQQPSRLLVLSTKDGSVVAAHSLMRDCDGLQYDARRQRIYASCGGGTLDVFRRVTADEYELLDRLPTGAGARTCRLSADGARLFTVVPASRERSAELRVYEVASNSDSRVHESQAPADQSSKPAIFDFDTDTIGTLPNGWKVAATNHAEPLASWAVISETRPPSGTNALALTASRHGSISTFNLCWTNSVHFSDGDIELSVKANGGTVDQGGGPIWRVQDANTYYIARGNPLEKNFRVYHVKDGQRTMLASADVSIPASVWHTIRIQHRGDHIIAWLNDQKLLDVRDVAPYNPRHGATLDADNRDHRLWLQRDHGFSAPAAPRQRDAHQHCAHRAHRSVHGRRCLRHEL